MPNTSSLLYCPLESSDLEWIASEYLGVTLSSFSLQEGGLFNTTYQLVGSNGQKWILRIGPIHRELLLYYEDGLFPAETMVFEKMEKAKIPCSHVVCTGKIRKREFMIVDYIDSVPLSSCHLSSQQWDLLMKEVANSMSLLHQMTGPSYGRVAEVQRGRGFPDWFSHVLHEVVTILAQSTLVGCFTTEEAEKIILAVTANREALSEVNRPTLCHGDLWSGNLLVTEKEGVYHLAGIIDVDRAVYGDIDFDLGNPWMQLDDQLIQPQEGVNRQIRREIYAMMYSLFEAHVWHVQYCNQEISKNAKKTVLEKAEKLIQREEKTDQ